MTVLHGPVHNSVFYTFVPAGPPIYPTTIADVEAWGLPTPTSINALQESGAGTAVDSLGVNNLTPANAPSQGVATTLEGGTRLGVRFTSGGVTRLDAAAVGVYNLSASLVIGGVALFNSDPAANSQILGQRDSGAPNAGWEWYLGVTGIPRLAHDHGAATTDLAGTGDHTDGNWHPFILSIDETNGRMWFNTDLTSPAAVNITTASPSQLTSIFSAGRGRLPSVGMDLAYLVFWTGADASGWEANRATYWAAFLDMVGM